LEEEILFHGHPNIRALHRMTIEVTRDENLTRRGDCIIGVRASRACSDLPDAMKRRLADAASVVGISVIVSNAKYEFEARGSQALILTHKHDMVIRKSSFVCPRTLAVRSERASSDLPREMIGMLRDPGTKGLLLIRAE
jgi:hypothetical protein